MANNSKALVRVDGSPAQRLATYRAFEQQVTKGETVTLQGLQSTPELNGQKGTVKTPALDTGRTAVELEDGQVVNVQRKNMSRALYQDPLHALSLLESQDRSRWKDALADLREKVFPGPYTREFLGFDGLRVLLGVAERIIMSEDTETGPALWEIARILFAWSEMSGGFLTIPTSRLVELVAPDQEEKSLLEATFTWVMNDGSSWEDAKRLPDVPETDEDAAAWVGEVARSPNAGTEIQNLLMSLEGHRRDPRLLAPVLGICLRLPDGAAHRVAVAALTMLADLSARGALQTLDRILNEDEDGRPIIEDDVVFIARNLRRLRPLVDRVAEHQYAMEEVQAAFALGEFVSALKEEAKNQAMLKNGGAHNAPAIGGQLSDGAGVFDDAEAAGDDGRRTVPFVAEDSGVDLPLVAAARRDGFGRLALVAVLSNHAGEGPLRPIAAARGVKVEQLNGTVYGMLSHPVADEAVRATIGQDEIVFVGSEPIRAAMLAAGALEESGKTYVELPVLRVVFPGDRPAAHLLTPPAAEEPHI